MGLLGRLKQGYRVRENRHTGCKGINAMKANRTLFVLLFLLTAASAVFAGGIPSGDRRFMARNMTDSSILITMEIAPSEANDPSFWWGRSLTNEYGEEMWLYVFGFNNWREPPHSLQIPAGSSVILFWEYRNSSLSMSHADRFRLLFTSFIVTDEQGTVLKTLDTLTESDFIFDNKPTDERPLVTGEMMLLIR